MPTQKPRVTFTISKEELARVDDFRFSNKMKNQTQAILRLIELGLNDYLPAPCEAEKSPPILQDGDETLLTQYHKLDEGDRGFIRGEIAVLLTAEKYQQDAGPAAI